MNTKIIISILIACIIATWPFYKPGYFKTQDGEWAIVRLAEMKRELRDLQLPPRWSSYLNHGYGYPLFLFTYPLPYYVGSLISSLGLGLTDSIKTVFVIAVVISAFGMYYWSKKSWGMIGGLVSSLLYIFMPYRLVDLYSRGSIGEIVALAIAPWLMYTLDKVTNEKKSIITSVCLIALLILSHNASALIILLGVVIFNVVDLVFEYDLDKIKRLSLVVLLGVLLSSFFWLPAIAEKQYIFLGSYQIADRSLHYVSFMDLFVHNNKNNVKPSLLLGIPHALLFLVSLYYASNKSQKEVINSKLLASFAVLIISLFLQFSISRPFWNLPLIKQIDFPWRFMLLTGFVLSFQAGSIAKIVNTKIVLVVAVASIIYYSKLINVTDYINRQDEYYSTNDATTTSNDELMPIWVKTKPKDKPALLIQTSGEVVNQYYDSKNLVITVNQEQEQKIVINSLYFPGWKYYVNNNEVTIKPEEETGLISFTVPQGTSNIVGKLTKTRTQHLADFLSIGTAVGVLYTIISKKIYSK